VKNTKAVFFAGCTQQKFLKPGPSPQITAAYQQNEQPFQEHYPPHVVKFMKRNPTITRWWKDVDSSDSEKRVTTVVQFYSLLDTYNEAVLPQLTEPHLSWSFSEWNRRGYLRQRKRLRGLAAPYANHKSKSSCIAGGFGTARWSASSSARWSSQ